MIKYFISILFLYTYFLSFLSAQDILSNGETCISEIGAESRLNSAYSVAGQLIRITNQYLDSSEWLSASREARSYNENGDIASISHQEFIDGEFVTTEVLRYNYNDENLLSGITTTTMDALGNELSVSRIVNAYNDSGSILRQTEQLKDGDIWVNIKREVTTYVESGDVRMIRNEVYVDTIWQSTKLVRNTYDDNSRLSIIRTTTLMNGEEESDDRLIIRYTDTGEEASRIAQRLVDGEWIDTVAESFNYNEAGDIRRITTTNFDSSGELESMTRVTLSYTDDNELEKRTVQKFVNGEWINVEQEVIAYGENGLVVSMSKRIFVNNEWTDAARMSLSYNDDGELRRNRIVDFEVSCDGGPNGIDEDNDGFAVGFDCDDNDTSVNPAAIDIPDNGIDEDCSGADESMMMDTMMMDTMMMDTMMMDTMMMDTMMMDTMMMDTMMMDTMMMDTMMMDTMMMDTMMMDTMLIVDMDMDGFGAEVDCDDNNPLINPGAQEVGENEIDEDCDGIYEGQDLCDVMPENSQVVISGSVATENGFPLDNTRFTLQSLNNGIQIETSDNNGEYVFSQVMLGDNYRILVRKETEPWLGVTTLDLVLTQRHILARDTLSLYNLISADVNRDNNISVSDILVMRTLILGIIEHWEDNRAWIFVPETDQFVDELNPWPIDESLEIDSLSRSFCQQDFIAIKRGDVNHSFENELKPTAETRSFEHFYYKKLETPTEIQYDIYHQLDEPLLGFQFALDGVEGAQIINGALDIQKQNYHIHDDKLMMSWHTGTEKLTHDERLFSIVVPKSDNEDLSLLEGRLRHEMYVEMKDEVITYDLDFSEIIDQDFSFAISQNVPNPFSESSNIDVTVNEDVDLVFTIQNTMGQVIYSENRSYTKGKHSFKLSSELLPSPGLYLYSFTSGSSRLTRKMIRY